MIRRLILALALIFSAGSAKALCTLPFTLTSDTLADATQVMANFNALNTCLFGSISGTLTVQGNTSLGGTLFVGGLATFNANAVINGGLTTSNGLIVSAGATTFGGNVTATTGTTSLPIVNVAGLLTANQGLSTTFVQASTSISAVTGYVINSVNGVACTIVGATAHLTVVGGLVTLCN